MSTGSHIAKSLLLPLIFFAIPIPATAQISPGDEAPLVTLERMAEQGMTVHGVVLDTVTHNPIPGARVDLDRFPGDRDAASRGQTTLTDASGHFEFLHAKWDSHFFFIARSDYISATGQPGTSDSSYHVLVGPSPLEMDLLQTQMENNRPPALNPAPQQLRLFLTASAHVAGTVLTRDGRPMKDAPVILYQKLYRNGRESWNRLQTGSTNKAGAYAFTGLPAGTYVAMTDWMLDGYPGLPPGPGCGSYDFVPRSGYAPTVSPGVRDFHSVAPITLTAGQHALANIAVVDEPFYPVSLNVAGDMASAGFDTILDANGRGLELPMVPGSNCGDGISGYRDDTTKENRINLPSGSYTMQITGYAKDDPFVTGKAQQPTSLGGYVTVTIADAPVKLPPLQLHVQSAITTPIHIKQDLTSLNPDGSLRDVCSGKDDLGVEDPAAAAARAKQPPTLAAQSIWVSHANQLTRFPERIFAEFHGIDPINLPNLMPGSYWLHIDGVSQGYVSSATAAGVDLAHEPLLVGLDGSAPPIEITLRNDCGRAYLNHPEPSSYEQRAGIDEPFFGVLVPQFASFAERLSVRFTEDRGRKTVLGNLPPGHYKFYLVRSELQLQFEDADSMKKIAGPGQDIWLKPGAQVEIPVTSPPDQ